MAQYYKPLPPDMDTNVPYIVWRYYYEGNTKVWEPTAASNLLEAMNIASDLDSKYYGQAVITEPVELLLSDD